MKLYAGLVSVLVCCATFGFLPAKADAALIGSDVTAVFDSFLLDLNGTATVGAGVELSSSAVIWTVDLDVTDTGFSLVFRKPASAGNFTMGTSTLNLSFVGADPISGVSFASETGLSAGTPSNITFDSDSIFVNFGFLGLNDPATATQASLSWNVTTQPTEVPEPATLALLVLGFAARSIRARRFQRL